MAVKNYYYTPDYFQKPEPLYVLSNHSQQNSLGNDIKVFPDLCLFAIHLFEGHHTKYIILYKTVASV